MTTSRHEVNEIRFAAKKDITKNECIFMLYFELDKDVDIAHILKWDLSCNFYNFLANLNQTVQIKELRI